jgi:NADP-dependent 3-hydroxy acid dehydrogenase YdfG
VTDFRRQIAVITGAGSGIGKAIALELGRQGATIILVGRRMEKLKAVADSAMATATMVRCYPIDLTKDDEILNLTDCIKDEFKGVDLLIHSAAVISLGYVESAPLDEFDRQYRTNVRAPFALTQALLPTLRARRGQIVFINSQAGLSAGANSSQYSATKYALKAIADSLRSEVNACGIRVLSVYPGRTASTMQSFVHEMEGKKYTPESLIQPEDIASVVINSLTLPRSAEVTDISVRPLLKSY